MANLIYNKAKGMLVDGSIDWDGGGTIKVALVSSTSTYTPNPDDDALGGASMPFSTATFEADGTGHTRGPGGTGRKTLAGRVVTVDDTNDRAELDCNDFVWTALSAGTIKALLVYWHASGTDDTLNFPILWIDQPGGGGAGQFAFVSNGGDFTFAPNVEGLIQLT